MKVLHVLEYSRPNVSGYSSRSDAIIRHQRQVGIDTCQMTSQRYQDFTQLEETVGELTYYRTPRATSLLSKIPLVSYYDHIKHLAKRIEQVVHKEKPDLIQAHSPMLNGMAASLVGQKLGIPVTYEVRALWEDAAVDTGKTQEGSLKYRLIRAIEQNVFKRVNAISGICQGLRQEIVSRGFPEDKVFVTPNAVDIENFTLATQRDPALEKELGLENKKVLAFIGSFFKYEGLQLALDALYLLKKKHSDYHLLLVGSGNDEAALKEKARALDLEDMITFTGRVPFEQVNKYYSLADVMVFPRDSLRLTELVTPLKPLESMAQGKPVIASDIGGHRELIEHERTGLLFKYDEPQALADAIETLFADETLKQQLVSNGLEFVQKERNWLKTAECYLPVYQRLVKEHGH